MKKYPSIAILALMISGAAQASPDLVCTGTAVYVQHERNMSQPGPLTISLNPGSGKFTLFMGPQKFDGRYNYSSGDVSIKSQGMEATGKLSPIDGNHQTVLSLTLTDIQSQMHYTIYAPVLRCK